MAYKRARLNSVGGLQRKYEDVLKRIDRHSHNTRTSLTAAIVHVMTQINKIYLVKASQRL